jgi:hypothetical protein
VTTTASVGSCMDAGCVYLVNSVSAMPPIHPEKDSCLHGVCSTCGFLESINTSETGLGGRPG